MEQFERFKFIVLPTKYTEHMSGKNRMRLRWICRDIEKQRRKLGKDPDPRYYVCNIDEPYSEQVIEIIMNGENSKDKSAQLFLSEAP